MAAVADACCSAGGPAGDGGDTGEDAAAETWRTAAAVVAVTAWAAGVVAEWTDHTGAGRAAFVVAVVAGGSTFVPASLRALLRGRLGVGLLMTIALVGAVVLGQFGEAASLAFLFSISEALEEWAVSRSRRGLRAVLSLVPDSARVRRGLLDQEVPTGELRVGDRVVLRTGERAPTDGIVREGDSSLDVSAVTGESIPVDVGPGDPMLAGSINGAGVLVMEVAAPAGESTLARIVAAVEHAQDRKGRAQRLADRIARPLVPGILVVAGAIALLGVLFGDDRLWLERALVVLVAASPCAFAIAVPVTVFAAIGAATKVGLVIKGGAALEALGTVRTIALDKTGTLTRNQPAVVDVAAAAGYSRDDVLRRAAALEALSDHPLAAAIVRAAPSIDPSLDVRTESGHGLTGTIDGRSVRVGKPGYVDPAELAPSIAAFQAAGATSVLVELDGTTIGAIAVRDDLRSEAAAVVAALRTTGMHVVMLTGDNAATAATVARAAGIDDVRAELLPDGKTDAIERLARHGPVAMVGDGINDAPALATAAVGIAMGAAGTDVALEAADIAIMGDDLTHLPAVVDHARRTRRIMIQNLILSGLIIAGLIPVAATGLLGLGVVVAVHELGEIVVIANGLRARRQPTNPPAPTNPSTTPMPQLLRA